MNTFEDCSWHAQENQDSCAGTQLVEGESQEEIHPLTKVGQPSAFEGTVKSFLGNSKSVAESQNVAAFALKLGIDFYRKDRSTMTRLLGPLPGGAWIEVVPKNWTLT